MNSRIGFAALAAVLVAAPAGAFVRESVQSAGVAVASPKSSCANMALSLYWNTRSHDWYMFQDSANPNTIQGDLAWSDVQTAMAASEATWAAVSGTDITFNYKGTTAQFTLGFDPNSCTNENIVVFREKNCSDTTVVPAGDACLAAGNCGDKYNCWGHGSGSTGGDGVIALTTLTSDSETGEIVDADQEYNSSINATTMLPYNRFTVLTSSTVCNPADDPTQMNCVGIDVQNTATHEWGHFLGLGHTTVATACMFPTAPPGQETKRVLDPDDISGITTIYPKGAATAECIAPNPPIVPPCAAPAAKKGLFGCSSAGTAGFAALAIAMLLMRRRTRTVRV